MVRLVVVGGVLVEVDTGNALERERQRVGGELGSIVHLTSPKAQTARANGTTGESGPAAAQVERDDRARAAVEDQGGYEIVYFGAVRVCRRASREIPALPR
jgi:hypothetical protein